MTAARLPAHRRDAQRRREAYRDLTTAHRDWWRPDPADRRWMWLRLTRGRAGRWRAATTGAEYAVLPVPYALTEAIFQQACRAQTAVSEMLAANGAAA